MRISTPVTRALAALALLSLSCQLGAAEDYFEASYNADYWRESGENFVGHLVSVEAGKAVARDGNSYHFLDLDLTRHEIDEGGSATSFFLGGRFVKAPCDIWQRWFCTGNRLDVKYGVGGAQSDSAFERLARLSVDYRNLYHEIPPGATGGPDLLENKKAEIANVWLWEAGAYSNTIAGMDGEDFFSNHVGFQLRTIFIPRESDSIRRDKCWPTCSYEGYAELEWGNISDKSLDGNTSRDSGFVVDIGFGATSRVKTGHEADLIFGLALGYQGVHKYEFAELEREGLYITLSLKVQLGVHEDVPWGELEAISYKGRGRSRRGDIRVDNN